MSEAKWYVVHTYSGYENKVKANIDKTIENRHLEDQILEVRVPLEDVVEMKNGVQNIFIGREFGVKTVLASLMLPMYLRIFEILTPHVESLSGNIVIDLVCFMIVVGAGQAVLFNMNASSGGIDIVAKLINKYLGFKIGQSITIIGVLISMAAIFVYDRETMVISLVGTLIYGQVLDRFCDGFHVRKKVSILSKEHEKIQNYIVRELRRGATIYPAYGGLDHAEHVEVVTILEKNEYGKLLSFIHETDEHAFVTVSTVNEVVGAWNTVKSR